jgi:hypothetical protein
MKINNNLNYKNNYYDDDNDDINEINNESNSDLDIESEEEIDDETQQILYNALNKNNNSDYTEITIKINNNNNTKDIKNKKKIKETYNLNDFVNKFKITEEVKKTKKFISKRVADKKEINNIPTKSIDETIKTFQRNFCPRLPPYNLVKKEKEPSLVNLDIDNQELFPSL